jgi:F420-dependent oxidoreductase-like protein
LDIAMKLGLQIVRFNWPGSPANIGAKLADIAQAADEAGFISLWVMDHFFQMGMRVEAPEPMLEAYTTLAYLAALTRRIRLGAMVTGVIYRSPGLLVKAVTNLDVLSGGRAYLGLGAAWYELEAKALGFPFPPLAERFERLEETLQIARQMWAGNTAPYHGRHYQLVAPVNDPPPLSRPHPPILIGGGGEKKTLRLVAQYGNACNLFAYGGAAAVVGKLDVLRRHCEALGRPYDEIERTALGRVSSETTTAELIATCRSLAEVGIQHFIFNLDNVHDLTPIERIGREVIPAVAEW